MIAKQESPDQNRRVPRPLPEFPGEGAQPELSLAAGEWLEDGCAQVGPDGLVVALSESLRAWLGLRDHGGAGVPFWSLLCERCPSWTPVLDQVRTGTEPFGRLDLPPADPDSPSAGPSWYRLEVARHPACVFVRLTSILPPREELAETGWAASLRGEAAGRELFVRLLRTEAQLGKLTQYWPGVIFSQRPDFSFEVVNGRIEELTGRGPAEWQQRPARFWDIIHESDAKDLQHKFAAAARARQSVTSTFRVRNLETGKVSYVLEHRRPVGSRSGLLLGYEGVWLDVTRQTLAEKLLTSAAWKETLAVLTMGLAHDFSNVMAGIHSLSETFLTQLEAGHPFHEGLGLIRKSSMQASQLVHRIVNLHLGKPGERNFHDLNQIVGELLELVRKIIPRRIEITTELCPGSLPVHVDAFEFRQVIINLALNAADAMPERGRLVFRTCREAEHGAGARYHGATPRLPMACVSVQDSGCGIKAGHLDLIFDPFFTTKAGSKGSGLGLYNARLFAEKHQGGLRVESEEGRGSSFHVCLPEADFTEETPEAEKPREGPRRRALLLLGASSAVLDRFAELLRTHQYHVAIAHSLERVADFLGAGDYTYDALIALVESPGLVLGSHVTAWRRSHPQLKLVLRPVGRNEDELESELRGLADLVLTPELSPVTMLERLRGIFPT